MGRAVIVLGRQDMREKAARWVAKAPPGTRVEFKGPKRTLPQNDKMWAMLTEVSEQLLWHGMRLTPDQYKLVFLDGLRREMKIVPNLDGSGFVNLNQSSSDLSIPEMADMITLIEAFGASHGVIFNDDLGLRPKHGEAA